MKYLVAALASIGLFLPSARADRIDFLGELRSSSMVGFANAGQFGTGDDRGPCGVSPRFDFGQEVSGTATMLATSRRYRHQLSLSVGYIAQYCTPILRRPVFGLDYKAEHALTSRTRLSGQARATVDVFDRTLDVRSGSGAMMDPNLPTTTQSASGQFFITPSASIELSHAFSEQYGLRVGLSWKALELLEAVDTLPTYSTLGPMESVEVSVLALRNFDRHRFDLPLRYRLSALYSGTLRDILPRSDVKPAHDVFVGAAWEYKLDQRFTVRTETGLIAAAQPHLCTRLDPLLVAGNRCSIDGRVQGIRGNENPPPLEVAIGTVGTLSFGGEVSLGYVGPRRRFDVRLARGYEPDPYAGALSLWDRLGGDFLIRPFWELAIYGSAQLMHGTQTSPGRVSPPSEDPFLQLVSPQNRTMYLLISSVGGSYRVVGPLSVFAEGNVFAMAIRGERVPEYPALGQPVKAEVSRFPTDPTQSTQNSSRFALQLGIRVQFDTLPVPRRESELLRDARALP